MRRVHGVVPDRRPHQQTGRRPGARRRRAARRRVDPPAPGVQGRLGHVPRAQSGRGGEAADPRRRDHLPRRGLRLDRVLPPRGDRRGLHQLADRAREAGRRGRLVQHHPEQARQPAGAHALGREWAALHSDRCAGGPALRQAARGARGRRSLRRDDLHELSSPLGDRSREDRRRRPGDAAERPRHPSEEQDVPRGARSQVPGARARDAFEERSGSVLDAAGIHQLPARPGGTDAVLAGRGDRPAGGRRGRVLPRAPRLREGERAASGRRRRARVPGARHLLRRNGPPRRRRPDGDLHGARSRGRRQDCGGRLPPDALAFPGHPRRARSGCARARRHEPAAGRRHRARADCGFSEPGADGGAEPPGARSREVHAL